MFQPANVRTTIDSLNANVTVLDHAGRLVQVNECWRRFGARRNAASDYVGLNYLKVCADAAKRGDADAGRVEKGLRRLLDGEADTFGKVYRCGERIFRMSAHRVSHPAGGLVVAHQDITALMDARRELQDAQRRHATCVEAAHEELAQRLTAISLAAGALEHGGNVDDAITLIKLAVEEARQELKLLRYENRRS